jgi:GH15 family glucan-1,4-alpha-glucosidase
MDKDLSVIESQQFTNKLLAAGKDDYHKVWIRDNVYVALAYVEAGFLDKAATIYSDLYQIISKYEHILNEKKYPTHDDELLHPRFDSSGEEIPGHWSNKQHDAIGILLFGVGQLYLVDEDYISNSMRNISQKLINYLEVCEYWQDKDNGMWEEGPALHASSLAACVKGIEAVSSFCTYDKKNHDLAVQNLAQLLPSVIRYIGDKYESVDNIEAEWVLGVPWLGIANFEFGFIEKARKYLAMTEKLYTSEGLPEAYSADSPVHNPLAWSHAMTIVLRTKLAAHTV